MDAPLRAVIGQLYCCGTFKTRSRVLRAGCGLICLCNAKTNQQLPHRTHAASNTPSVCRSVHSFDEAEKPQRAVFSLTGFHFHWKISKEGNRNRAKENPCRRDLLDVSLTHPEGIPLIKVYLQQADFATIEKAGKKKGCRTFLLRFERFPAEKDVRQPCFCCVISVCGYDLLFTGTYASGCALLSAFRTLAALRTFAFLLPARMTAVRSDRQITCPLIRINVSGQITCPLIQFKTRSAQITGQLPCRSLFCHCHPLLRR